ncbi:MAG: lysozyme [Rhodocyclaceae bacterium]
MNRAVLIALGVAAGVAAWAMARRQDGGAAVAFAGFGESFNGFVDTAAGTAGAFFGGGKGVSKRISFAGIEVIKQFEGFRSQVYDANPPKGDWTIGYGHKLKDGESFPRGVTQDQARALLVKDVGFAEDRVNRNITRSLTQSQFDALVSLAYNLTTRSWLAAASRINAGEPGSTVFARYVYAGGTKLAGLVSRRNAEIALYYKDSSSALA